MKEAGTLKDFSSKTKLVNKLVNSENQEFISTPKLTLEQKAICALQVLIPYSLSRKTLGFMGPLNPTGILENFVEFFLVYYVTKPIVNKTKPSKEDDE